MSRNLSAQAKEAGKNCKSLDIYGRPVQLTFHGQEKIKTPIGACLTVIIVVVLLLFAVSNTLKIGRLQPPIQTSYFESSFYSIHKEYSSSEILRPNKIIAFGLGDTLVDPRIGKFVVRQEYTNKLNPKLSRSTELPIAPCTETRYVAFLTEVPNYKALYCLEDANAYQVRGDINDVQSYRVHLSFVIRDEPTYRTAAIDYMKKRTFRIPFQKSFHAPNDGSDFNGST